MMDKTATAQQQEFGRSLKTARERAGKRQAEVAEKLNCAPTSLTNWESGKIEPPLEMLGRLCEVLEISPLDLLCRAYQFDDIVSITEKPADARSYQERVALNFSHALLQKLLPIERQRKEAERVKKTAAFLRSINALERFGGTLKKQEIEVLQHEYSVNGGADADILFAFHSLTVSRKGALLEMIRGLLSVPENIQSFHESMDYAVEYTQGKLSEQARLIEGRRR